MKRTLSIITAAILASAMMFTSCASNSSSSSTGESSSSEKSSSSDSKVEEPATPTKLKIWAGMHSLEAKVVKDKSENEAIKKLIADYGNKVEIQWEHPPVGMEKENFSLMVSSGDLPDIIFSPFTDYKGGALKAIDDGVLLDVTDLVEEHAPNFKEKFYTDPNIKRAVFSDDGRLINFGVGTLPINLSTGEQVKLCYTGLLARKDLMENAGFTVDTLNTIEDWENMLTSFKDQGVSPLLWAASDWDLIRPQFLGAYGVSSGFYKEGDTVKFGPMEEGYKQWLETFARWYKNGLIDPNFTTYKYFDNVQADMTAGKGGVSGYHIYDYKLYYDSVAKEDPSKALIPVNYPVLKKGDTFKFQDAYRSFSGSPKFITTACENPIEAIKFIDYIYTPESAVTANWGIEGESYEKDDAGEYHFTDKYTSDETVRWKFTNDDFRCVNDSRTQYESYTIKEQLDAWKLWDNGQTDEGLLPPMGLVKTADEAVKYSQIMADINTYVSEMTFGFIMGDVALSEWDTYVNQLKSMNIEKATEITQATYDRYLAR